MRERVPPIDTREALLLVFFATFIVATRAAMRWHLGLAGHSMLAGGFGLVLVRSCVDRRFAASLCGLLAGGVIAGLGMGRGGPLIVLKLLVPGMIVDLGASPRRGEAPPFSISRGATIGALAGASAFLPAAIVEALAGIDGRLLMLHALASASGKAVFGALGGAAGAWVARELAHHGLLPKASTADPIRGS